MKTGYKVKFNKQVHGCFASLSSLDVYLERTITMPIPPTAGMYVSHGEWEATVESVSVDAKTGGIEVHTPENKELYEAGLHRATDARTIKEIVKEYTDTGWKVSR